MYALPVSAQSGSPDSGLVGGRLLWSPRGRATRRQWWLGHVSAALLGCLGFVGLMGVLVTLAAELGLEEGGTAFKLLLGAAVSICLLQFMIASNALSSRRLSERRSPRQLADLFVFAATLEAVLKLCHGLFP